MNVETPSASPTDTIENLKKILGSIPDYDAATLIAGYIDLLEGNNTDDATFVAELLKGTYR